MINILKVDLKLIWYIKSVENQKLSIKWNKMTYFGNFIFVFISNKIINWLFCKYLQYTTIYISHVLQLA